MEMESIIKHLENKTILVTGATGFLGKIFLEKILRIQPNIKKVFLLIRASDPNSTMHRLHTEIIGKELFRVIKEKHGSNDMETFITEKVTPVASQMDMINFGVTNFDLLKVMQREVDVVVNCAANTNFDERYDVAFATNTLGVRHVSNFIKECKNIKLLLHVSTVFLEKILRIQPNIKKVFLLIRASDPNSTMHRLHTEIIGKELFRVIKEKHGNNDMETFITEKVTPVASQMDTINFGVTNFDLLKEMRREVDVVVNCAANTNLDERYDVAFATNTLGVRHVSNFIKECKNIKVLLHVSTAYVSGEKSGIMLETPFKMGETLNYKNDLNIEKEMMEIEETHTQLLVEKANKEAISQAMKDLGSQRANMHGWPNTYVFTKAMGEMLLLEELRQDVSLVILRPTIVTSTYKEPFPGWIEGVKTVDAFIAAFARGRTDIFLADPDKVLDLIPADIVINAMVASTINLLNKPYSRTIYHVGSSMSNPIKNFRVVNCMCDYFSKHPLTSRQGNPIITTKNIKLLSSMSSFERYITIRYKIPLMGVKYANIIFCKAFSAWYLDADRKIKIILRLAALFKPYVLVGTIYDDANLKKLHCMVNQSFKDEMETMLLDVKSIDWEDYLMNIHIPGLVKHAFRK